MVWVNTPSACQPRGGLLTMDVCIIYAIIQKSMSWPYPTHETGSWPQDIFFRKMALNHTPDPISHMRWGPDPDPNRPTRQAFFGKLALTHNPDAIRPMRRVPDPNWLTWRAIPVKTGRPGPCPPADRVDVVFTHNALQEACLRRCTIQIDIYFTLLTIQDFHRKKLRTL